MLETYQNNKKNPMMHISMSRWIQVCEFITAYESFIKEMLCLSVDPAMIRTEIYLENVVSGPLLLKAHTEYPETLSEKVIVASVERFPYFNFLHMNEFINNIDSIDMLMSIVNQIEIE